MDIQHQNMVKVIKKKKLNKYIDEYIVSGVIDDILDFDCRDFKVWAAVINDGLRDRKPQNIKTFIDLILDLFEHKVLDNRNSSFETSVIKWLCIQLDESYTDCPKFCKYVGKLFGNLVYHEYLKPDATFSFFTKKYKEFSEYATKAKKIKINKVIRFSVEELEYLQAHQRTINIVEKYRQ